MHMIYDAFFQITAWCIHVYSHICVDQAYMTTVRSLGKWNELSRSEDGLVIACGDNINVYIYFNCAEAQFLFDLDSGHPL